MTRLETLPRLSKLLASVSLAVLLTACAVQPHPFTADELKAQAASDRAAMFADGEPVTKPLSLSDAVTRALTYNLDHRTKIMEAALALGQTKIDRWDVLPKLAATAGYDNRSDHATVRSRDSITLQPSLADPYYSLDRSRFTEDLTVSWNVLDFGVSYLNARQNADRALIAEERRRKTVHNLVQEVRYAYWRTAAAQVLEGDVAKAVALSEQALDDARRVETARLRNPADALRLQKTLLENLRQLESISEELSTARVELAALVNLPPGTPIQVEVPADKEMTLPPVAMPMEEMEETALVNNADLREQSYDARIAAQETRKTILKLLPGISFTAGSSWDSNSFLVDNQWYHAGAFLSWNIFSLLAAPDNIANAHANERVTDARRIALRMAVLAQVHVGYLQYVDAVKQYQRADQLYDVEKRLADVSQVRSANSAQSVLDRIANQSSAIVASLRRYQSYALAQQALGRLHATLGEDVKPGDLISDNQPPHVPAPNPLPVPVALSDMPTPAAAPVQSVVSNEPIADSFPVRVAVAHKPLPTKTGHAVAASKKPHGKKAQAQKAHATTAKHKSGAAKPVRTASAR